ncbi:MAG: ABC transporter permease [Proteobacteria bacterium]|nr:ABC transporter permease [Pseudomonadota bacterium]MDA0993471.1 ABC transporter permease [Pseudomonadota bacterium]
MLSRIYAIFRARNLEFVRDRGSMSWNLILPIALMFGLSFIFSNERAEYTVGVLQTDAEIVVSRHPFLDTRYIEFVTVTDRDQALRKVSRHQLDMLIDFGIEPHYWVNPDSPKGYFVEFALLQSDEAGDGKIVKSQVEGDAVRYVDWVLPGILGMNMMFSCLFGVGYVVVRYRKNGFLKRLRATPLRSIEFVIAQVASRLILILAFTSFIFAGTIFFLDIRVDGSYLLLFLVLFIGAISLISLGLLIAARVTSEELAGGLLNMVTWPMMMLSGVWFSLEAASDWVRDVASIFPLTHILNAARAIMLDGAGFAEILSQLITLIIMSIVFLGLGAFTFRWHPR